MVLARAKEKLSVFIKQHTHFCFSTQKWTFLLLKSINQISTAEYWFACNQLVPNSGIRTHLDERKMKSEWDHVPLIQLCVKEQQSHRPMAAAVCKKQPWVGLRFSKRKAGNTKLAVTTHLIWGSTLSDSRIHLKAVECLTSWKPNTPEVCCQHMSHWTHGWWSGPYIFFR